MDVGVSGKHVDRGRHARHGATWWIGRWPMLLQRMRLGRLLGDQYLVVTHRGRRSGRVYKTAVMVLRKDEATGDVTVIAGNRRADWFRNIQASPPVGVSVGNMPYDLRPRFLSTDEVTAALRWSRTHQRRNARVQAWFFHWPWPADEEQLRELASGLGGASFAPMRAGQSGGDPAGNGRSRGASDAGPIVALLRRLGMAGPLEYLAQIGHGVRHPHLLASGATAAEKSASLPGDDAVPDATFVRTRACTVFTAPTRVWPWVAQLGARRGGWPGWYPFVHPHDPAATHLLPAGDEPSAGDILLEAEGAESLARWQVLDAQAPRRLVLHSCRTLGTGQEVTRASAVHWADISWAFVLEAGPEGTTRLLTRTRSRVHPRWYQWIGSPLAVGDTVMQRELLAAIARRAENDSGRGTIATASA